MGRTAIVCTTRGLFGLLHDAAKSSVVLDRNLDQEKSLDPSGPRIRCPLCGWEPRKGRPLVLHLRPLMEHVRDGRSVPRLSSPVDFDTVSLMCPLVTALRVVCALSQATTLKARMSRVCN